VGVGWAFALVVVLATVLRWTVFGRHLRAMGPNEQAARLRGVKVITTKVVMGVCLGVELKVTATVVTGGDSLSGGQGSVLGTLAGVCHQGRHREWLQTAGPLQPGGGPRFVLRVHSVLASF
jgi:ribose transport system permease protein